MSLKRVVVTGMGSLTPIGNTNQEYWEGLKNGVSGSAPIVKIDTTKFKTKFACELKNFNIEDFLDRKDINKMDPYTQYAMVVAQEAFEDSNIDLNMLDVQKVGVIWGSGIGGVTTIEKEVSNFALSEFSPKFSPFFIPKMIADIAAGFISMKYGFMGVNFATVSACASSANAIIDAYNYIRLGKVNMAFAGGSEACINGIGLGGFNALHALSTRNEDPKTASRPFDKDREGFVMGEGAGCLVLEEHNHAIKRGAKIYAEIVGGGLSADAHHITAPHPEGLGAKQAMISALEDSNIELKEVDLINTHGTSTPLGDIAEARAIKSLFGDHAYKLNINSTKSMTGHLLGAAGVVELISCIMSINYSIIPPTINHFTYDENIDSKLNFTFNEAQQREINIAISNTFGFGGHNTCIAMKKYKG